MLVLDVILIDKIKYKVEVDLLKKYQPEWGYTVQLAAGKITR
ncbi:MAG: hypothetical protein RL762_453 [Bacteroidota bacterium]|jgi:hypothetical protein